MGKAKMRYCWNCGVEIGVIEDKYYDSRDTCVYRELRPYDYVTESPNVSGDDRSVLPLADPTRLAVQVEEPT